MATSYHFGYNRIKLHALCVHFLFSIMCSKAQTSPDRLTAYKDGMALVEQSIKAMKISALMDSLQDIGFTLDGHYFPFNQGHSPMVRPDSLQLEKEVTYRTSDGNYHISQKIHMPDGRFYTTQDYGTRDTLKSTTNYSRSHSIEKGTDSFIDIIRHSPFLLLDQALQNRSSIHYLGSIAYKGKKESVVAFALENQTILLHLDNTSKLVTASEVVSDDVILGDHVSTYRYGSYKRFHGHLMPTQLERFAGTRNLGRSTFGGYRFNFMVDSSFPHLPETSFPQQLPQIVIKPIVKGLFLAEGVGGNYRCPILQLDEGLLVFDAPVNSEITSQLISKIKKTFPDQAIQYLVASHFHDDHIGGFRSFVAEGITIVTSKGNEAFLRQMAGSEHSILPDALTTTPKNIEFLFIEKSHRFNSPEGPIEIVKLSKNSHAHEMLIAYLPVQKTLIQSDLFNFKVTDYTREFLTEIKPLDWNIETLISSHGGVVPFKTVIEQLDP